MTAVPIVTPRFSRSSTRFVGVVATCFTLAIVLRLLFFEGLWGADDLHYVRFATLWDRLPANHWEARLLYNAVLRLSILAFGRHELAYAMPGLAASLILVGCSIWFTWQMSGPLGGWAAGLIVASLPLDVGLSTVPLAGSLCAAFAGVGTVLLLSESRLITTVLACIALALAIVTHVTAIFYVGALTFGLVITAETRSDRLRAILCGGASILLFIACELGLYGFITGDPLYEFRLVSTIASSAADVPDFSLQWFLWPIQAWVFTKNFGPILLLTSVLTIFFWRSLPAPLKALAISIAAFWLWVGYGTVSPVAYEPFWRDSHSRYAQLLVVPIAILLASLLAMRPRAGALTTAAIAAVGVLLMASSGPWGQNVEISREFMSFIRSHPSTLFLADPHTRLQLFVLNQCEEFPNVVSWDDDTAVSAGRSMALLLNPLNPTRLPDRLKNGRVLFATKPAFRPIAAVLPDAFVAQHPWFVRRPPGHVSELMRPPQLATGLKPHQDVPLDVLSK